MKFDYFYQRALERSGGEQALLKRLPTVASKAELEAHDDSFYLAEITRCVFRAGFVWRIIDHKWPGFQAAFSDFVPAYWQQVPPERLDDLTADARIVRNMQKIDTVPVNARMIVEMSEEHGSFGRFLSQWPANDQAGLLLWLKANGARLGGVTAQYFLRRIGYDGFILSADVVTALENHQLMDASPTSKKGLLQAQKAFNQWHEETGRPYSHLSRILSCTLDAAG
ncbi:MAG: DNA-3-methyladenine glycosylase I [Idiomarina sp.]